MKTFGEIIKQYRKDNKLTQEDFAKIINKTQVTISNYEKDVHFPSDAEEIKAIANILSQSVVYIVDAIQYSRNGIIENNQPLPTELTRNKLRELYNFTIDGVEVSEEELNKMIHIVRFERFMCN